MDDYSDDGLYGFDDDDDGDEPFADDFFEDDKADEATPAHKESTVLSLDDLQAKKQELVDNAAAVLNLPGHQAEQLLRLFAWDANKLNEEWFTNEQRCREKVGLLRAVEEPTVAQRELCKICFEAFDIVTLRGASCGHLYCEGCYRRYISEAIRNGPSCLNLRCPTPDCGAMVRREVVEELASEKEMAMVRKFELEAFVEGSSMVWCPAAGCSYALERACGRGRDGDAGGRGRGVPFDAECRCGHQFCSGCLQEPHRPVGCETVRQWLVKSTAESESCRWILANTKPCPRCKRPIEKNQGCMHMTCSQCRHDFCWLCQEDWKTHNKSTGGYFQCLRYERDKRVGLYDEETRIMEYAKMSLERYMHYFERYNGQDVSRQKALESRRRAERVDLDRLSEVVKTPNSQLKFVLEAWDQIADSRRTLKWTYAQAYYWFLDEGLSDKEKDEMDSRKDFLLFVLADAEASLDRLHEKLEKGPGITHFTSWHKEREELLSRCDDTRSTEERELAMVAKQERLCQEFATFRMELIGLTSVTAKFFVKLVAELENGFPGNTTGYGGAASQQGGSSSVSGHASGTDSRRSSAGGEGPANVGMRLE